MILSILGTMEFLLTWSNGTDIGLLSSVYLFLSRQITLSTCIRMCASCLDISTSSCESCFLPFVNAGTSTCPPWIAMSSPMVKPQFAKITLPGSRRLRKPDSWLRFCQKHPHQHCNKKDIVPQGVMPIKNLTVLCFLLLEYVCAQALKLVSVSM